MLHLVHFFQFADDAAVTTSGKRKLNPTKLLYKVIGDTDRQTLLYQFVNVSVLVLRNIQQDPFSFRRNF